MYGQRTLSSGMVSRWYQLQMPEYGREMFSETSVVTRSTWYKVPEGICNLYRHESIPEDTVL
jgi:hypothetical protein